MKIRYLLDENMPNAIISAVQRLDPAIDIIHVGQGGAPPLGTLDPDILRFCEREQRLLVTQNRTSMPLHIADYFQEGGEHWGIFEITEPADIG